MAADLLGVSRMTVNTWVRAGKLRHLKIRGQPSAIALSEVKRVKRLLQKQRRLRGDVEREDPVAGGGLRGTRPEAHNTRRGS